MSDLYDSPEPATFVEPDVSIVDEPVIDGASFNDAGADAPAEVPAEDSSAADVSAIAEDWSAEASDVDEEPLAELGDASADAEPAGWDEVEAEDVSSSEDPEYGDAAEVADEDWGEIAAETPEVEVPDTAPEDWAEDEVVDVAAAEALDSETADVGGADADVPLDEPVDEPDDQVSDLVKPAGDDTAEEVPEATDVVAHAQETVTSADEMPADLDAALDEQVPTSDAVADTDEPGSFDSPDEAGEFGVPDEPEDNAVEASPDPLDEVTEEPEDVGSLDSGDAEALADAPDGADLVAEAEEMAQSSEQAKALFEAEALATDSADAKAAFDASVAEKLATSSDTPTMPDEVADATVYEGWYSAAAASDDAVEHATDIGAFEPAHTKTDVGSAFFAPGDDILSSTADVPDYPGEYVLDLHGSPDSVSVPGADGVNHTVDAAEFANIVQQSTEWNGEPIRLFSCETGQDPNGFAQQLADELGVEVTAPTEEVSPNPLGKDYPAQIAESKSTSMFGGMLQVPGEPGEWKTFKPKGGA